MGNIDYNIHNNAEIALTPNFLCKINKFLFALNSMKFKVHFLKRNITFKLKN